MARERAPSARSSTATTGPTPEKFFVAGKPASIGSPREARRLGIGIVFQNFSLIPALSVWENIALFLEDAPWAIGPADIRRRAARLAERLRFGVDFRRPVGRLSVGDQQKVEILKQLLAGARVLILDEPTKVLAPQEADGLFRNVAALRDEGHGIVYITHKLGEVAACADRVVVMRQGRVVGSAPAREASQAELVGMMFGALAARPPPASAPPSTHGEAALSARADRHCRRATAPSPCAGSRCRCAAAKSSASRACPATDNASLPTSSSGSSARAAA